MIYPNEQVKFVPKKTKKDIHNHVNRIEKIKPTNFCPRTTVFAIVCLMISRMPGAGRFDDLAVTISERPAQEAGGLKLMLSPVKRIIQFNYITLLQSPLEDTRRLDSR